jgi:hypothetical protein
VRAALHARDELADDDFVAFYLDTFGDGSRAYLLRCNPLGAVADGVFLEGSGTDLSIDLELRSAGRLTPTGWEVEVALPWSSLRYPQRAAHRFGLHVLRQARVAGEESTWRPLPAAHAVRFPLERKLLLDGAGAVAFDDPLRVGGWLEATPSLAATAKAVRTPADESGGWREDDPELRAGLTTRAGIGRDLVLELAARPDFGEV